MQTNPMTEEERQAEIDRIRAAGGAPPTPKHGEQIERVTHEIPEEVKERTRAYWERVNSLPDPHAPVSSLGDAMRNLMRVSSRNVRQMGLSVDDAKKVLWQVVKIEQEKRQFTYDFSNTKDIVHNLILYFLNRGGEYDNTKGLYLYGNVGRGKTELMRLFTLFTQAIKFKQFKIASSKGIVHDVSSSGSTDGMSTYFKGAICFDDFGFEEQTYKLYGNNIRVMETIIEQRYQTFTATGTPTHVTSNVKPDLISEFYDPRIVSRLYEMVNFIEVTGIDFRKNK